VSLDPGIAHRANGDRQGEALQSAEKSTCTLSHCAWKPAKRSVMAWKRWRTASRWSSPLFEAEVGEVVGDQLVAQEGGELFVLLQKRVFEVGAEDVMTVLNVVDDGGQLAAQSSVQPGAEDLADLVAGQPPQAELAAAFEQLVDGKVALEDEVAAILDLGDCIEA